MVRPVIGPPVLVHYPPELIEQVDASAAVEGITRSEWLRRAAANELRLSARRARRKPRPPADDPGS